MNKKLCREMYSSWRFPSVDPDYWDILIILVILHFVCVLVSVWGDICFPCHLYCVTDFTYDGALLSFGVCRLRRYFCCLFPFLQEPLVSHCMNTLGFFILPCLQWLLSNISNRFANVTYHPLTVIKFPILAHIFTVILSCLHGMFCLSKSHRAELIV